MKQPTAKSPMSKLCKTAFLSLAVLALGSTTSYAEDCMKHADLKSMSKCERSNAVKAASTKIEDLRKAIPILKNNMDYLKTLFQLDPSDILARANYQAAAGEYVQAKFLLQLLENPAPASTKLVTQLSEQQQSLEQLKKALEASLGSNSVYKELFLVEYQNIANQYGMTKQFLEFIQVPSVEVLKAELSDLFIKMQDLKFKLIRNPADAVLLAEYKGLGNEYAWKIELLRFAFVKDPSRESTLESEVTTLTDRIDELRARLSLNPDDKAILAELEAVMAELAPKSRILMFINWKSGTL